MPNLPGILVQIQFEGYGPGSYWQEYDDTYVRITPKPLRVGVSNFFDNLQQPVTTLNLAGSLAQSPEARSAN